MPGLDGLRAVAVIAVLLYHGQDLTGVSSFLEPQGGFLGVEMFFVISGFLITALLLQEHERTGTIALKDFWIRRARRLLPALFLFLGGTTALAALFADDALDKIRNEIVGALLYVSNWLLIANDQSYFEASGRPSLLRHLWSLAIEEQFYLVWPLLVFGVLRFGGRRALVAVTAMGIAGSTALLWSLFDQVEQYGDVTEVYYRTDARAAALLVGSVLAMVWKPWSAAASNRVARWGIDVLGVVALAVVIVMQYAFTDRVIEWASYERLYHGGFLALSAGTALVIAAVSMPGSQLGWVLGTPVLRWIGIRSYGIYLWHWPVFQLTRPRIDVDIDGYLLFGIRMVITFGLVEISYRLIESPIRQRRFWGPVVAAARTPRGIMLGSVGALGLIMATTAVAVAIPTIDRTPATTQIALDTAAPTFSELQPAERTAAAATEAPAEAVEAAESAAPVGVSPTPDAASTVTATVEARANPTATPSADAAALIDGQFIANEPVEATPVPTPTQPPLPPPPPLTAPFDMGSSRIHIVGDSVIEGAQSQLYRIAPQVTVDGRIGRQWWELEGELRQMRAQGLANDVVVIQLGNNGNFTTAMFDGVMNALAGTRLVLFVNIHAPVVWEGEVNGMLTQNVNRYPDQARLIDWYTAAEGHPDYFIEDGTHLQGPGMVAMRSLIENALLSLS